MKLFNTFSKEAEELELGDEVKLYVCGITPYDTTHLGHARTYLTYDLLIRHLRHCGKRVDYIQNITDIDDSIVARAEELGEPFDELGNRFISVYMDDIARLGMIPARTYPRATEAIKEIVTMIEGLEEDGFAYRAGDNVYFRIARARGYGKLSGLTRAGMLEVEAEQDGSTVDAPGKEDPLDPLLWRGVGDGGPAWKSPWGLGRPGWHIECSVLAIIHLGATLDIHGGGDDLVFPHHDGEIAQSEAYTGAPFARYWMHVAMARLHGEKMSKSDGNMIFVRDLLERYSPDAIRLYLASTHYRSPLDYDPDALAEAQELAAAVARTCGMSTSGRGSPRDDLEQALTAALDDDLDTPAAVGILAEATQEIAGAEAPPSYETRKGLRAIAGRLGLQLSGLT